MTHVSENKKETSRCDDMVMSSALCTSFRPDYTIHIVVIQNCFSKISKKKMYWYFWQICFFLELPIHFFDVIRND